MPVYLPLDTFGVDHVDGTNNNLAFFTPLFQLYSFLIDHIKHEA